MFEMKKKMSPSAQKAKLTALKEAHKMASSMMKDDLSGLKKVTVASDSKDGLKAGLEKAEDMLGEGGKKDCSSCPGCPECEGEQESEDSEMGEKESYEADAQEDDQESAEPMDMDELEAKIQELMKMKAKLQK
jgi:hypothetical protein